MNCITPVIGSLILAACPLLAHHSVSAEFDVTRPVTYEGAVTGVDWSNPHVYVYIAVQTPGRKATNWAFQAAGPNTLAHRGWLRDTVKPGDRVAVVAYPARDGVAVASLREVRLSDGRRILAQAPQAEH